MPKPLHIEYMYKATLLYHQPILRGKKTNTSVPGGLYTQPHKGEMICVWSLWCLYSASATRQQLETECDTEAPIRLDPRLPLHPEH